MGRTRNHTCAHYEITVEGELDAGWADLLGDMTITLGSQSERPISTLIGPVTDQAALRGIVCKLWDLNLTLIKLQRMETPTVDRGGKHDV